jgi:hypothetical protein
MTRKQKEKLNKIRKRENAQSPEQVQLNALFQSIAAFKGKDYETRCNKLI